MNGNTRLAHFPYIAQAFARALKNGVFFCFRPAHARKGRACMRDDCCGLRPFGVMRPVPASPRAGFGRLKARPRSTIYVSYAPSPRGSPAASRRRLARVVVRVGPIATRAQGRREGRVQHTKGSRSLCSMHRFPMSHLPWTANFTTYLFLVMMLSFACAIPMFRTEMCT